MICANFKSKSLLILHSVARPNEVHLVSIVYHILMSSLIEWVAPYKLIWPLNVTSFNTQNKGLNILIFGAIW